MCNTQNVCCVITLNESNIIFYFFIVEMSLKYSRLFFNRVFNILYVTFQKCRNKRMYVSSKSYMSWHEESWHVKVFDTNRNITRRDDLRASNRSSHLASDRGHDDDSIRRSRMTSYSREAKAKATAAVAMIAYDDVGDDRESAAATAAASRRRKESKPEPTEIDGAPFRRGASSF